MRLVLFAKLRLAAMRAAGLEGRTVSQSRVRPRVWSPVISTPARQLVATVP
jgi:hypothetical protein